MKNEYLPTVKCPCCKKYYVIKCAHAESPSEADDVCIQFKSDEYIEIRVIHGDEQCQPQSR